MKTEKTKKTKEHPKLRGFRLFKKDSSMLRRIAKKERDQHGHANESHAVRNAIKEKYDRMFPTEK